MSRFTHDPEIKVEAVWAGETLGRANVFAERRGLAARLRSRISSSSSPSPLSARCVMMLSSADRPPLLSRQLPDALLRKASERCQLVVVSHARPLVDALERHGDIALVSLEKELGETIVRDMDTSDWKWPGR